MGPLATSPTSAASALPPSPDSSHRLLFLELQTKQTNKQMSLLLLQDLCTYLCLECSSLRSPLGSPLFSLLFFIQFSGPLTRSGLLGLLLSVQWPALWTSWHFRCPKWSYLITYVTSSLPGSVEVLGSRVSPTPSTMLSHSRHSLDTPSKSLKSWPNIPELRCSSSPSPLFS